MKTIAEINAIAPYHPCEWQEGYGIWQSGFMEGQKSGADEQKAIDDAELAEVRRQRDAYYDELLKLRVKKLEWIEKAVAWLRVRNVLTEDSIKGFRKSMEE